MLQTLGLDVQSEEVYKAMLSYPSKGVSELAELLGRTEREIRASLDRLNELALVQPSQENGLAAVAPELGMEVLLARQQAELAVQQQRIKESRAAAAQLVAQYTTLDSATARPNVEQLFGIDRIRDKLALLTREVGHEVMTFAPNGSHTQESLDSARPLDEQLLDRGVTLRTIYLDSVRNSPHTVAYADWLAERGGQVRTVPSLPVRMILVDRQVAVIPARADAAREAAVVLRGHGALAALCALFEAAWGSATELGDVRRRAAPDASQPNPQEREVLRFLAQGLTDEAIAKRLGVSPRTARRIANSLMERLGARSRFQAGALAAEQGWLSPQSTP